MFSDNSRYKSTETYTVTDSRGRTVTVVGTPKPLTIKLLGYHRLLQGQRMDHLAYKYLGDGTAFWKIAEANSVVLPEALTERQEIIIPTKM
jgi:hypothetical protein